MNCIKCEISSQNYHPADRGIKKLKPFPDAHEKIKMVCAYIDRMYTEDLSRIYLSSLFGMNEDWLSRNFNRFMGMKLNEYIYALRILHSMRLLRDTESSITRVSMISGFDNIRTFNRAFRKVTSVSPTEYRKRCTLENV